MLFHIMSVQTLVKRLKNGKKPVVLIGGMNGRGKTTILEAVLLSLYGSNSFAYTESKYTTYGQYLKSYINKTDGSLDTFVEIEFAMDKSNDEIYTVRRDWDGKGQRVKERITVLKNGEENKFLTENWSMFVENILPSALSNFFFFDGEKIAKLAVEETSEQMKESIKAMLGITVLDVLQGDIGKIINKISKNIAGNQDLKKLEELRSVKETAEQVLEEADVEIEGAKLKLEQIIKKVATECKKCVVGALYDDFDGVIYSFDLKESGLILNYCIYDFMLRHKSELEKLNYYSWARFLEQVNDDNALIRVINKLELATPKREDLSVYREILRREFEEDTCFYCGKKLQKVIHVDHFIPWSFVKDDKIWNFVLSCPTCNEKKNNRVPGKDYLIRIEDRNKKIQLLNNTVIQTDFAGYSDDLIGRMWSYAKLSGIKEYRG